MNKAFFGKKMKKKTHFYISNPETQVSSTRSDPSLNMPIKNARIRRWWKIPTFQNCKLWHKKFISFPPQSFCVIWYLFIHTCKWIKYRQLKITKYIYHHHISEIFNYKSKTRFHKQKQSEDRSNFTVLTYQKISMIDCLPLRNYCLIF